MKSTTSSLIAPFLLLLGATGLDAATCSIQGKTTITFYGYPDNSPPGAQTAHNCGGRNYIASSGDGSYNNPVTMATAKGEFQVCETIYVPYLEKYVRYVTHWIIWSFFPVTLFNSFQLSIKLSLISIKIFWLLTYSIWCPVRTKRSFEKGFETYWFHLIDLDTKMIATSAPLTGEMEFDTSISGLVPQPSMEDRTKLTVRMIWLRTLFPVLLCAILLRISRSIVSWIFLVLTSLLLCFIFYFYLGKEVVGVFEKDLGANWITHCC